MRSLRTSTVVLASVFCAAAAFAGQHGHSAAPTTHGAPIVAHAAPTPHAGATAHSQSRASTTTHGSASKHTPTTHGPSKATTTTTTRTTAATSRTTATGTPIATKIESHPQLASKLTAMLPQGMTLQQAASGFRNQGQFIAALHVSQNLGIPFADLKTQMVTNHLSLGQSIQKLRPEANTTRATKQAETETDHDITATTTSNTKHGKKGR